MFGGAVEIAEGSATDLDDVRSAIQIRLLCRTPLEMSPCPHAGTSDRIQQKYLHAWLGAGDQNASSGRCGGGTRTGWSNPRLR